MNVFSRYFSKINIKLFAKFATYSLGEVLNKGSQFLIFPIFVLSLSVDDFGKLEYLLSLKNSFSVVALVGLTTVVVRYSEGDGKILGDAIAIEIIMWVFVSFFLFLFLGYNQLGMFILISLIILTFNLRQIVVAEFRCQGDASRFVVHNFINVLIYVLLLVLLAVFGKLSIIGILYTNLIANACSLVFLKNYLKLSKFNFKDEHIFRMVSFGVSSMTPLLLLSFFDFYPKWLMSGEDKLFDLGNYSFANKVSLMISVGLASPISIAWLPYVRRLALESFSKKLFVAIIVYLVFSTFAVFIANYVVLKMVDLFFIKYVTARDLILPYMIYASMIGLYYISISRFFLMEARRQYIYSTIFGCISLILFSRIFVDTVLDQIWVNVFCLVLVNVFVLFVPIKTELIRV
jgi:O-antigen/teichoic acid export membrane protein